MVPFWYFMLLFFLNLLASEILVPQPGIEPMPLQWELRAEPLDH